jgi:hypothetical protein
MVWNNNDGLFVKFGIEEGRVGKGGEYSVEADGSRIYTFYVTSADVQSATPAILGSVAAANLGTWGVDLPKGLLIESVETIAETPVTTSGALGTLNLSVGLIRDDRITAYAPTGLTAATFVGTSIDAQGEKTTLTAGSTGAGTLVGTILANNGVIVVANAGHATAPFTGGKVAVRVKGYFPV